MRGQRLKLSDNYAVLQPRRCVAVLAGETRGAPVILAVGKAAATVPPV
jgi:hypothetical protein